MKLEYGLLVLALGLVYGIIKQYFPDFPIDQPTLLAFVLYVLLKLGVEIVNQPLRNALVKRGFTRFAKN